MKGKSKTEIPTNNMELYQLVKNIENLEPEKISPEDNLTPGERKAISDLSKNNDIVIKPADKGSSIVIMNADYYRDKIVLGDHLLTNSYQMVDLNSDGIVMDKLGDLFNKYSTCLTEK